MVTFFGIVTDTDCCNAAGTLIVRAVRLVPESSLVFGVLGRVGFASGSLDRVGLTSGSLDCLGFFGTVTFGSAG